jgi:HK97 family phage prohead protease
MIHRYTVAGFRHVTAHALRSISERASRGILSSGEPGSDGLVVDPLGIDTSRYNGIVLWQHRQEDPVGKCIPMMNGRALEGRIDFAPEGISDVADVVCGLVKAGILSGISIGFDPMETMPRDKNGYRRVTRSTLLEVSIVSVGADPGARVTERAAGWRDPPVPHRPVLSDGTDGAAGVWGRHYQDFAAARLGMRRLWG